MKMGDTVVGVSATADDQTPLRYASQVGYAPTATFSLAEKAAQLSREASDTTVHVGLILSSGIFYDPDPTTFSRWKRLGHLGVEMEAAMMYTIAAVKRIESLAIMTVSDLLGDDGSAVRISDEELKKGVDQMMEIGCRVAIS
jgi:5'-methylthioadenosine phosphorylase/purine-nucleoside phosphorylase